MEMKMMQDWDACQLQAQTQKQKNWSNLTDDFSSDYLDQLKLGQRPVG
jgi:hypothetical protein